MLQCFWEMCCIHLQTDCIWFRWKLNRMGGGNESIIQGGYEDCCGSELNKGKRRAILSHASSVKDLSWQSFYIINPFSSISFSLCLKQIQLPRRWAWRIPQKHRINLTILQRVITYKTINCAIPALKAWTLAQTFIYSVFLMAKPDVNVFSVDKIFMVNGMLTEWSCGKIWLGHAAFGVPVTDFYE